VHDDTVPAPVMLTELIRMASLTLSLATPGPDPDTVAIRWFGEHRPAGPEPEEPEQRLDGYLVLLGRPRVGGPAVDWPRTVEHLVAAGAATLAIGVTPDEDVVPGELVRAALAWDVPVVRIPPETTFDEVTQALAGLVFASDLDRANRLAMTYGALTQSLAQGRGVQALVEQLHGYIGAPTAVEDLRGRTIASSPLPWPTIEDGPDCEIGAIESSRRLRVHGADVGRVRFIGLEAADAEAAECAATVIALELGRLHAYRSAESDALGSLMEEVAGYRSDDAHAQDRLDALGIDGRAAHRVVLARLPANVTGRLRSVPWQLAELVGARPTIPTGILDELVVMLVPGDRDALAEAHALHEELLGFGSTVQVGLGAAHQGVSGLRMSWHEALEASSRGPGVHEVAVVSLAALVLQSQNDAVRRLAAETLTPLKKNEAASGADLVHTLATYLEERGSVSRTAARLFVHRNTLRHRLKLIETLTGRRLDTISDWVTLWLPLVADGTAPKGSQEDPNQSPQPRQAQPRHKRSPNPEGQARAHLDGG
jgi:PucR family transcriptional regulator, purine catabolism regulatory protein